MTQWTITRDFQNWKDIKLVGISGPNNMTLSPDEIKTHKDRVRFRLYDDDKELYCEGFMVGDSNEFAPLDNYGTPSLGCTEIHLADKAGKFSQL